MATDLTPASADRRRPHTVRWVILGVVAAVLLPLVLVFGSRLDATRTVESPLLGRPAPSFTLENIDGGTLRSEELAGRPYVVNFWASWCPPCIEEHPHLEAFYARYQPRGVEMLGVIYSDTVGNARRYRDRLGGGWPILEDPRGRMAIDFGVRNPPETFVVDSSGTVVVKIQGAVGPGALEDILSQVQ